MRPATEALIEGARRQSVRDIARLVSLIEDDSPEVPEVMRALGSPARRAQVVGVTGPPGVGKSTTTAALIAALRARGERVAVLAVDPSSPFSGGALLGDRIRMADHATDGSVFIRSMASRGHLGGLAATTPAVMRVLDAAGFDTVIVETVGVGQSEVEVAAAADTTVVLLAPGMGDSIQAAKAGILEIGDVFVVNKADRGGADATIRELRTMIALGARDGADWEPSIVRISALTGLGLDELLGAVDAHRDWLAATGAGEARRLKRAREEVESLVVGMLRARLRRDPQRAQLDEAARSVALGEREAHSAAEGIVAGL